jgi:hypothetical protein
MMVGDGAGNWGQVLHCHIQTVADRA